jgi:hypothetical protein
LHLTACVATAPPGGAPATTATAPTRSSSQPPAPTPQNPSPMVERTRAHDRVPRVEHPGTSVALGGILPRPVDLHLPPEPVEESALPLLVHFLGASHIPLEGAHRVGRPMVVATVNLSPGSAAYEEPLRGAETWPRLLAAIDSAVWTLRRRRIAPDAVFLSAFSAGNGAVRGILGNSAHASRIAGVLILDGVHTGYQPPRRVVAEGGTLDPQPLRPLEGYARRALKGDVRLVVTHSEVFPGTFASTTETADWLLDALGEHRQPVLRWGPMGMQQTSEFRRGGMLLFGYAGNSAPDHLDHLHALPELLPLIIR